MHAAKPVSRRDVAEVAREEIAIRRQSVRAAVASRAGVSEVVPARLQGGQTHSISRFTPHGRPPAPGAAVPLGAVVSLMLNGRNAAASLYVNPVISGYHRTSVFQVTLAFACAASHAVSRRDA
jgi:hypothetical protein